jgi:hypothetical protein
LPNLLLIDLFLLLLNSLGVVGWEEVDFVHHLPRRGPVSCTLHDNGDQRVQKRLRGEKGGVDHGRGGGRDAIVTLVLDVEFKRTSEEGCCALEVSLGHGVHAIARGLKAAEFEDGVVGSMGGNKSQRLDDGAGQGRVFKVAPGFELGCSEDGLERGWVEVLEDELEGEDGLAFLTEGGLEDGALED